MAVTEIDVGGGAKVTLSTGDRKGYVAVFATGPKGKRLWRYGFKVASGALYPLTDVAAMRSERYGEKALAAAYEACGIKPAIADEGPPVDRRKVDPARLGELVMRGEGYELRWKNGRPQAWANFVVVFAAPTSRKSRYHIGWNGERFNDCRDHDCMVAARGTQLAEIEKFLRASKGRFVKLPRNRRQCRNNVEQLGRGT